jgi:TrmH family RNA methyltransferase
MQLRHLEIVLVHPETARNVGSVARACKNFGVDKICIVGSPDILDDGWAKATAHSSTELLDSARLVATIEEALAPHSFVIGTANRVRKGKLPPLQLPHEVLPDLAQATKSGTCAIVFGPESRGLTDMDLACCTRLMRIPTEVDQPSLNLSQAVLVALQECWRHAKGWTPSLPPGASTELALSPVEVSAHVSSISDDANAPPAFSEFDLLLTRVEALMGKAGFRPYVGDPESFRLAARRSLSRGRFERRDLRTFLTMVKTLERLTDRN